MSSQLTRIALLLSITFLAACPGPGEPGPTAVCTKAEEKCVLASGVLGVCNTVDCRPGQPEPCLVCRSQH